MHTTELQVLHLPESNRSNSQVVAVEDTMTHEEVKRTTGEIRAENIQTPVKTSLILERTFKTQNPPLVTLFNGDDAVVNTILNITFVMYTVYFTQVSFCIICEPERKVI